MATYVKRIIAAAILLLTWALAIGSIAPVLSRINAVNAAATSLDTVLGRVSGIALVGILLTGMALVMSAVVVYRWATLRA